MKIRKLLIYALLMWALIFPIQAQAAPVSRGYFIGIEAQFFTDAGAVCAGCNLHTYITGTTTNRITHSCPELTGCNNANPVVLDSAGRAQIYLDPDNAYTMVLKDSADSVTIWTEDEVTGAGSHVLADIDGDTLVEVEATADADTIKFTANGNQKLTIGNTLDFWKGITRRAQFTYVDANTITIDAALYEINGKMIFWDAQLTTADIGTPTASTWVYLYLDDSTIGTASLEETDTSAPVTIIWSESAPSWSDALHGWYNGNDRAIFAVYSDGSQNITEFFHSGEMVLFADGFATRGAAVIAESLGTEVTLTMPAFARQALVHFVWNYVNANVSASWRTEGQTGSTGHGIGLVSSGLNQNLSLDTIVIVSSNLKIDVGESGASDNTLAVSTLAWYFPVGM